MSIYGEEVLWSDDRLPDFMTQCGELYQVTALADPSIRLTQTPYRELEPKLNGRYVAYRRMENYSSPPSLRLGDRKAGSDIELAEAASNIESFDINDRYVVWVAYLPDPLSEGRDVLYRDLASGQTVHLDVTYDRWQWWVYL